ncbi:unnamed protein product [Victoria cruziana]
MDPNIDLGTEHKPDPAWITLCSLNFFASPSLSLRSPDGRLSPDLRRLAPYLFRLLRLPQQAAAAPQQAAVRRNLLPPVHGHHRPQLLGSSVLPQQARAAPQQHAGTFLFLRSTAAAARQPGSVSVFPHNRRVKNFPIINCSRSPKSKDCPTEVVSPISLHLTILEYNVAMLKAPSIKVISAYF